ncbi:phage major capsid protein [Cytobacillus sp. S13-E01]|uniref:phage major capsid protein n=1 Tax=Cytobacillus sp. S13-E01 TaxID=3031326 RepID=UPI0023D7CF7E|nr:phage major capsid protein [Cytobacillus sp. S13-E01]MDF0727256.1 phage major capsid protein [Cytobacillus sp. S13-E01]
MIKTNAEPGNLTVAQILSDVITQSKNVSVIANQFDLFVTEGIAIRLFSVDDNKAQIVDEDTSLVPSNITFAEIRFNSRRVGDAFEVSQELLNNEAIGLKNHLKSIIAKRNLKVFTAQALGYGTPSGTNTTFQSILDYNAQTAGKKINGLSIEEFIGGATVDNVNKAYGKFVQDNAGEAIIVVDSADTALALVDGDKRMLNTDNRNSLTGSIGTIHGIHVHVHDMNGKAKMVLMNPKAYAVKISADIDKTGENALSGKSTITASVYADGKVVDPNAIKIIKA